MTDARKAVLNRYTAVTLAALFGSYALSIYTGLPGWPLFELGRQTSFAVGCRTFNCLPLVIGAGVLYTVVAGVVVGVAVRVGRE
jgi:hypothetical protein